MSSLNWTKILARVTPRLQARVNLIRMQNDDLKRQIAELEANKPNINWDQSRKVINDDQFVNEIENSIQSFKPTKLNFSHVEENIAEDEKTLTVKYDAFFKTISAELNDLNDRITQFESAPPPEEINVEDFYQLFPGSKELAARQVRANVLYPGIEGHDELDLIWEPIERDFFRFNTKYESAAYVHDFIEEQYEGILKRREEAKVQSNHGARFCDSVADVLEKYDASKFKPVGEQETQEGH